MLILCIFNSELLILTLIFFKQQLIKGGSNKYENDHEKQYLVLYGERQA